jgi:hypothetical protein
VYKRYAPNDQKDDKIKSSILFYFLTKNLEFENWHKMIFKKFHKSPQESPEDSDLEGNKLF